MKYDFSVNMTVLELERMLAFAKEKGEGVIGVHFQRGSLCDPVSVSLPGVGWKDFKAHRDVTDWESV